MCGKNRFYSIDFVAFCIFLKNCTSVLECYSAFFFTHNITLPTLISNLLNSKIKNYLKSKCLNKKNH